MIDSAVPDTHNEEESMRRLEALQPSDCKLQNQSPLFGRLPAEIRHQIFLYVLGEQDGERQIEKGSFIYRPDFTRYRFIDTALLRTCRRTYLETKNIPHQQISFRLWLGHEDRAPPESRSSSIDSE
jgi:hypothetical protein